MGRGSKWLRGADMQTLGAKRSGSRIRSSGSKGMSAEGKSQEALGRKAVGASCNGEMYIASRVAQQRLGGCREIHIA